MVRAYRDQKRFDHAEALARQGSAAFGRNLLAAAAGVGAGRPEPREILEIGGRDRADARRPFSANNEGKATAMNVGAFCRRAISFWR